MKSIISILFIALAALGSSQPGYAAEARISGRDANTLTMIFQQAGLRPEPSINSGRSFTLTNGIRCVLQLRAPGAAFIPNCVVLDHFFNREFRVDERQVRALVSILMRAGVRPVSHGSATTLTTGGIVCQSDEETPVAPVVSVCYPR